MSKTFMFCSLSSKLHTGGTTVSIILCSMCVCVCVFVCVWGGGCLCVCLPDEHLTNALMLWEEIPHLAVHLLVDDEGVAGAPISPLHRLAGSHHVLTHALRGPCSRTGSVCVCVVVSVWV